MRRLLLIVCGVVLVETVFFSALAPLLPRYAHDLGLSKFGAGVLVGSYAAGGFVGALPGGFLASRLGVKLTMLTGLGLLAALSGTFGFARSVWLLDLARFGQGVGAALAWTGALAWLVTEAPRERRGELIGVAVGAAAVGALLGPAVGATATIIGTRTTFLTVALLGAALGACALRIPGPGRGEGQSLRLLLPAVRRPGVVTGLWLLALPSLMFGVLGVLAPLRLDGLGVSGSTIGAVFLTAAAVEAGASIVFGRWADRAGRELPLRASLLASVLACLLLPLGRDNWSLAVLVVIAATAFGAFFAPAMALLADQAEQAGLEQALGFALLNIAWAPGHLVGSAAGGAVAGAVGDAIPYLILAVLCTLTLPTLKHLLQLQRSRDTALREACS
jgi:predicted MFS family arabinose efflux permease